jgi:hypothetical protein
MSLIRSIIDWAKLFISLYQLFTCEKGIMSLGLSDTRSGGFCHLSRHLCGMLSKVDWFNIMIYLRARFMLVMKHLTLNYHDFYSTVTTSNVAYMVPTMPSMCKMFKSSKRVSIVQVLLEIPASQASSMWTF